MKKCIIVANGEKPKKSVLKYFRLKEYEPLIAADGGANNLYRMNIKPDVIIGDFDSIDTTVLYFYKKKSNIKIMHIKRQTDTDVEKCLKYAVKIKCKEVILLSATGNRLDHSFCNLGIVLKYFDKIKIRLIHGESILTAYKGEVKLKTIPGEVISIYGFDHKTKIKSLGLKYPLKNIALPFGKMDSTSNEATGSEVSLKISKGVIFVIRNFDVMRKNGLL